MKLFIEQLESRFCLATPWDVEFLVDLNTARANPPAYGRSIGLNLDNVLPAPPLSMDELLVNAATTHSVWMATNNIFGHNEGNLSPGDQMERAGFQTNGIWSQSIAYRYPDGTPSILLAQLIIDQGVPDLGHRIHLLAMNAYQRQMQQVGIGFAIIGTKTYVTIDTSVNLATPDYIHRLYNDLLGRPGSEGEVQSWLSYHLSPSAVASGFVHSDEWRIRQNKEFIVSQYHNLLHREPEQAGLDGWLGLMNGPVTQGQVVQGFMASGEYIAHPSPAPSSHDLNVQMVTRFYADLLHRKPDAGGLDHWTNLLDTNWSPSLVAAAFVGSQEYEG